MPNFNSCNSSMRSQVALVVKNLPANAGDIRDVGSIPELERSPGEGHSNPFQYSCLENPMDRSGLQSTGSQRVRHNWSNIVHTAHTHYLCFIAEENETQSICFIPNHITELEIKLKSIENQNPHFSTPSLEKVGNMAQGWHFSRQCSMWVWVTPPTNFPRGSPLLPDRPVGC